MRIYVDAQLLELRPYLGMPLLDTFPHNPNAETVWTGQTVHMQDCLYAYRENTDYIIFSDWDDILMVPDRKSLLPVLDEFFNARPSVASMHISRFKGNIQTLGIQIQIHSNLKYARLQKRIKLIVH
jgi:hypothetical protein